MLKQYIILQSPSTLKAVNWNSFSKRQMSCHCNAFPEMKRAHTHTATYKLQITHLPMCLCARARVFANIEEKNTQQKTTSCAIFRARGTLTQSKQALAHTFSRCLTHFEHGCVERNRTRERMAGCKWARERDGMEEDGICSFFDFGPFSLFFAYVTYLVPPVRYLPAVFPYRKGPCTACSRGGSSPREMGRPKKRACYVTKCRLPVGCFDLDSLWAETCWSSKNRTANSCRCNLLIDGMLTRVFGGLAVVPSLPGHQAKSLSKNTTTTTRRNWSNWLASKIHSRPASLFLLPECRWCIFQAVSFRLRQNSSSIRNRFAFSVRP